MTYNLGYSETGVRSCKITFTEAGTYHFDDLQVVCLPMADYVEDVTALGEAGPGGRHRDGGALTGSYPPGGAPAAGPVHPLPGQLDGDCGRGTGGDAEDQRHVHRRSSGGGGPCGGGCVPDPWSEGRRHGVRRGPGVYRRRAGCRRGPAPPLRRKAGKGKKQGSREK